MQSPCSRGQAWETAKASAGFRGPKSRRETCPLLLLGRTPEEGYNSSFGLFLLGFYTVNITAQSSWCFNMDWKQEKEPRARTEPRTTQKACDPTLCRRQEHVGLGDATNCTERTMQGNGCVLGARGDRWHWRPDGTLPHPQKMDTTQEREGKRIPNIKSRLSTNLIEWIFEIEIKL